MPDAPPDVLRDTFLIWTYVTMTMFDEVQQGATSDQLLTYLEQGKHIKVGDPQNKQTVIEAVAAVANFPNELPEVNAAFKGLSALSGVWTGGKEHPTLSELDSAYIPPLP